MFYIIATDIKFKTYLLGSPPIGEPWYESTDAIEFASKLMMTGKYLSLNITSVVVDMLDEQNDADAPMVHSVAVRGRPIKNYDFDPSHLSGELTYHPTTGRVQVRLNDDRFLAPGVKHDSPFGEFWLDIEADTREEEG